MCSVVFSPDTGENNDPIGRGNKGIITKTPSDIHLLPLIVVLLLHTALGG